MLSAVIMDESQKALSRAKTRLATLELTLKKRINTLVNILPLDVRADIIISPSPSMNSTYGLEPSLMSTPLSASTVIRKSADLKSDTRYSVLDESTESRSSQGSVSCTSLADRRSRV